MSSTYTARDITVLEGLEPVRKQPAMYIGGTDKTGYHHLLWEIVDNCIDEVINKHATRVEVTLHDDGKTVTVEDNGRGIPVDIIPKYKKPALEIIMTGRTVAADEAERIGLVSRIIDGDAVEGGMAFARTFSKFSLPVLALAREAVMRAGDTPINEGLKIEADLNTLAFQTEDVKEGMTAFIEKREAKFRDA